MKDILTVMILVREVIVEICGQTYPTASLTIPLVRLLEKSIDSLFVVTDLGKAFKAKVSAQLLEQFKHIEQKKILSVSTLFDPRFKGMYFKFATTIPSVKKYTSQELSSHKYDATTTISTNATRPPKDLEKTSSSSEKKKSVWSIHEELQKSKSHGDSSLDTELDQYLKLDHIDRNENPMSYWVGVQKTFPILSEFALNHLTTLGTSIPSERLFSTAGFIKSETRSRLTPEHVNMLVFLSSRPNEDWGITITKKK